MKSLFSRMSLSLLISLLLSSRRPWMIVRLYRKQFKWLARKVSLCPWAQTKRSKKISSSTNCVKTRILIDRSLSTNQMRFHQKEKPLAAQTSIKIIWPTRAMVTTTTRMEASQIQLRLSQVYSQQLLNTRSGIRMFYHKLRGNQQKRRNRRSRKSILIPREGKLHLKAKWKVLTINMSIHCLL